MRYPPKDRGSRVKCDDCLAERPDGRFAYYGRKCSDGKHRCEPHFVRFQYSSGQREAHGGFI